MKLTDLFEFGGSAPAKTGKVQRVSGNKVTMADPKTPGVTTTVDLTKMDIDTSDPKNPTVKPKNNNKKRSTNPIRPGQNITIQTSSVENTDSALNEGEADYVDPEGRFVVVYDERTKMYHSMGMGVHSNKLPMTDRGFKNIDDAIDDAESLLDELVTEGINDPNIFKAIFLAGGPGSGKGFVYKQTMADKASLKVVNPDIAYEFLMRKAGLTLSPADIASEKGQDLRNRAKEIQAKQEELYKEGRLGLVIDGTAKDADKIAKIKTRLDALGYDTMMVFVNTDLETNLDQNSKRERTLPDDFVKKMWSAVQKNMGRLQGMFGKENFHIIDNSYDQRPYVWDNVDRISKEVNQFLSTPPSKPLAMKWIEEYSKK